MDLKALITKHSQSGPRYTSYPTAPQWTDKVGKDEYYKHLVLQRANKARPLALYFHIPFCESLCYYCGCNIKITKDHGREAGYVSALLSEMKAVFGALGARRKVSQISWGGGTPTFLSISEMNRLYQGIREYFDIQSDAEVSIEVDPRVTSFEQLAFLRSVGFNRISLGVQDFNEATQKAINRIQSVEMAEQMLAECRRLGFSGINFDLIYGLPHQTLQTFESTLEHILRIRPDRIAFYNYAHLPQMIPHQKILDDYPMPGAEARVDIFNYAVETLTAGGYHTIGMDHFALETDELYRAVGNGNLYRNFMGYTVKKGTDMIGLGTSAIGEVDNAFFQNLKDVKMYLEKTASGELVAYRGLFLTPDDILRKDIIQALMCRFVLSYEDFANRFGVDFPKQFAEEIELLKPFEEEGSLTLDANGITILPQGRLFLRNIAMHFDAYLKKPGTFKNYSKTV